MSGPEVWAAAVMVVLGLPGVRYLTTTDDEERLLLRAVATRASEFVDLLQRNQAAAIVNAMIKARLYG